MKKIWQNTKIKLLAFDPGFKNYGYCFGILNRNKFNIEIVGDIRDNLNLKSIYLNINDLVCSINPDIMILEKIFMNSNPKTSFYLNSGRSLVTLIAEMHNIPLIEFNATFIKKSILNNGHASKKDVTEYIKNTFHINIDSNGADAILIAQTYINSVIKK